MIDYSENDQPIIKYPDRRATFWRNSPYLSQFVNDSWIDLEEQEQNIMEAQLRAADLKKLASETKSTHMEVKAMGTQTYRSRRQPFGMSYDSDLDEAYDDFMSLAGAESEDEEEKRKRLRIAGKQAVGVQPHQQQAESTASKVGRFALRLSIYT